MPRDILFLLKPNLVEGKRTFHCPSCAMVEGVLTYHPELREQLDIRHVDFARPRPAVIEWLGEAHQGCPVLIIQNPAATIPSDVHVQTVHGHRFIADERAIAIYLAANHGTTWPH